MGCGRCYSKRSEKDVNEIVMQGFNVYIPLRFRNKIELNRYAGPFPSVEKAMEWRDKQPNKDELRVGQEQINIYV